MNRGMALFFAIVGVLLLVSISFFIAIHQPWLVLLASVIAILFIGFGFILKARIRRRENSTEAGPQR